ncbi:MAG: hypothetical protein JW882_05985 [Deltaproteobacteria bacterium]|nr:hypothetical protein [Deltaproteobacteria bacterium]
MNRKKIPPLSDSYQIRCPKLGHQIYFSYCRVENMGKPCMKILDCWFEHFNVVDYLRNELSVEEWEMVFNRPAKTKVQSLVEIIDQSQES